MKKLFLALASFVALVTSLQAQDTLTMRGPKEDYLCIPDFSTLYDVHNGDTIIRVSHGSRCEAQMVCAKDTVTVYGIAAIVHSQAECPEYFIDMIYYPHADVSLDSCFGFLRLYDKTFTQYPEDLRVHMTQTPVSYYLNIDWPHVVCRDPSECPGLNCMPFPVYERYFETPAVMTDTFWVGYCSDDPNHVWTDEEIDDTLYMYQHAGIFVTAFQAVGPSADHLQPTVAKIYDNADNWYQVPNGRYFMFPIITPGENLPDDTTHSTPVDTTQVDTVGFERPEAMGRLVSLSPNPTSKQVQVLSSFGMSRVEIFNTAGVVLLDEKVSGLKSTLDISLLPQGTYLVRIHTPMGVVTRKLLVKQ